MFMAKMWEWNFCKKIIINLNKLFNLFENYINFNFNEINIIKQEVLTPC